MPFFVSIRPLRVHWALPSPTWIKVCEGANDKVQSGHCQHSQQQQLQPDYPLHACQVDSEQSQQYCCRHAAHRPLVLQAQQLRHRLREACDVHGSSYALQGSEEAAAHQNKKYELHPNQRLTAF